MSGPGQLGRRGDQVCRDTSASTIAIRTNCLLSATSGIGGNAKRRGLEKAARIRRGIGGIDESRLRLSIFDKRRS